MPTAPEFIYMVHPGVAGVAQCAPSVFYIWASLGWQLQNPADSAYTGTPGTPSIPDVVTADELDVLMTALLATPGAQLPAALTATYARKWQPFTAYTAGDVVLAPDGSLVKAKTTHTSGATYTAANWTSVAAYTGTQAQTEQAAIYAPKNSVNVLALGTSIAAAVGASDTAHAYPARTAYYLGLLAPWRSWNVIAAGVSGDTSHQMLARLPALLAANNPGIVTIEVSPNDWRTDTNYEPYDSLQTLGSMVAQVRNAGAEPVVIISSPLDYTRFGAPYNANSAARQVTVNQAVRRMCRDYGVAYADMFSTLAGVPSVWQIDGIHPNDAGHNLWGQALASAIVQITPLSTQLREGSLVVRDSFFRADASTLGTAWDGTAWGGTATGFKVTSNVAVMNTADNGIPTRDVGRTSYVASGLYVGGVPVSGTPATAGNTGLVVRYQDANNFFMIYPNTGASGAGGVCWGIAKNTAGTFTFPTPGRIKAATNDLVQVIVTPDSLELFVNGVPSDILYDTAFNTTTKIGLWHGPTSTALASWGAVSAG